MALFSLSVPASQGSVTLRQHAATRTIKLKQLNGIQPSFILLFTPVLLLPWHAKISYVKNVFCEKMTVIWIGLVKLVGITNTSTKNVFKMCKCYWPGRYKCYFVLFVTLIYPEKSGLADRLFASYSVWVWVNGLLLCTGARLVSSSFILFSTSQMEIVLLQQQHT